jgi:hypothetical protein
MMGKILMYLYLLIAIYCLTNVIWSIKAQAYQLTVLMVFLTCINFVLFTLFHKDTKRKQFRKLVLVK